MARTGALDTFTMITIASVLLLLIGLLILLYGALGKPRWAPIAWGLGNVAHASGMFLTLVPGYRSHPVAFSLANVLVMAALSLHWSGTVYFMGARRPLWLLLLPPLVTAIAFPLTEVIFPSQPLRILIVSVLGAVGCFDSGHMLLAARSRLTKLLGGTVLFIGLVTAVRAALSVAVLLGASSLTDTVKLGLVAIPSLALFLIWSVGMLVASADRSERELSVLVEQLRHASLTDQLTQLGNRRFMEAQLDQGAARLASEGEPFSVLLIDVDEFKKINDRFGHDGGDYVLRTVALVLQGEVQRGDTLARWGGEEFVVLLPGARPEDAKELAERLRRRVASQFFRYEAVPFRITVTIGGATAVQGEPILDLIRRADHGLYVGKRRGRNRVEWA